jgi:hypothetical protein
LDALLGRKAENLGKESFLGHVENLTVTTGPGNVRLGVVRPNDLGLSCASNMLPLVREVQAERYGSLPAYRTRCEPWLASPAAWSSGQRRRLQRPRLAVV